jgi:hypothetical protein
VALIQPQPENNVEAWACNPKKLDLNLETFVDHLQGMNNCCSSLQGQEMEIPTLAGWLALVNELPNYERDDDAIVLEQRLETAAPHSAPTGKPRCCYPIDHLPITTDTCRWPSFSLSVALDLDERTKNVKRGAYFAAITTARDLTQCTLPSVDCLSSVRDQLSRCLPDGGNLHDSAFAYALTLLRFGPTSGLSYRDLVQ